MKGLKNSISIRKENEGDICLDINIHQFSIGDISQLGGEYKRGGIAREVKQQMQIQFVSIKHFYLKFDFCFVVEKF